MSVGEEIQCQWGRKSSVRGEEIQCQCIILARKDEPTPDYAKRRTDTGLRRITRKDELTQDYALRTDTGLRPELTPDYALPKR